MLTDHITPLSATCPRFWNTSRNGDSPHPMPLQHHSSGEEIVPNIQPEPPSAQLKAIRLHRFVALAGTSLPFIGFIACWRASVVSPLGLDAVPPFHLGFNSSPRGTAGCRDPIREGWEVNHQRMGKSVSSSATSPASRRAPSPQHGEAQTALVR